MPGTRPPQAPAAKASLATATPICHGPLGGWTTRCQPVRVNCASPFMHVSCCWPCIHATLRAAGPCTHAPCILCTHLASWHAAHCREAGQPGTVLLIHASMHPSSSAMLHCCLCCLARGAGVCASTHASICRICPAHPCTRLTQQSHDQSPSLPPSECFIEHVAPPHVCMLPHMYHAPPHAWMQISTLEAEAVQASPRIIKGSGSSAMQLAMWKAMEFFSSLATSPMWLTYRPIGSGGGCCNCLFGNLRG